MLKAKYITKRLLWNALMAATVFLPTFLVMAQVQVLLVSGPPRRTTFLAEISNAIYVYLLFVLPLMLASLIYSLASFAILTRWSVMQRHLAVIVLASLLPLTVYLLNLPGGLVYKAFDIPTVIATILYGISTRIPQMDGIPGTQY